MVVWGQRISNRKSCDHYGQNYNGAAAFDVLLAHCIVSRKMFHRMRDKLNMTKHWFRLEHPLLLFLSLA